jgi:integrase
MASTYRRGEIFYAQWYRADGKHITRSTGCRKKREAERVAAELEAQDRKVMPDNGRIYAEIVARAAAEARSQGFTEQRAERFLCEIRRIADPAFRVVTLAEHMAGWMEEKKSRLSASTATNYQEAIDRFTAALPALALRSPIGELTRPQITAAMRVMKKKLRGSTVNLHLRALRQCLRQAQQDGILDRNPAEGIAPLPTTDSRERAPFTAAEVRQLIDHPDTPPEWRGMILFAAHTGLRLMDIARLSSEHITGTDLVMRPAKTAKTRRTVRIPLTPPLIAWTYGKTGAFFVASRKRSSPTLSMQFRAIMKAAGVPAAATLPGGIPATRSFHSLRHSFASWLAEADIHADVRKKLTGHSTAASHAIYTHHDTSLQRAIDTLPQLSALP